MHVTDDVDARLEIEEGRLTITAAGAATLYLETPDHTPLSAEEPHATLRVVGREGEDASAAVTLDGRDLDALADALYHARDGEVSDGQR